MCVRSDRIPCHHLGSFSEAGARRLISKPCQRSYGNRVDEMLDAASCTCISDSECLFGPLVAALFVLLVLSGNVFAGRRKPSDCKPIPLETHQLYSRLISCTRDSSVVLERLALSIWSSSVYTPFVGNPRVYPLCDPGPALSENLTSTCLS